MHEWLSAGIDVAEARKGLDLVVLDRNRGVVVSEGRLTKEALRHRVLNGRPSVVCIDSPSQWSVSGKSREAERALRRIGINAFCTGPDPGPHDFYRWIREGLSIFEDFRALFPRYEGGAVDGTAAEVFPHASAVLLAGRLRGPEESKRTFRREVLLSQGVSCADLPTLDRIDAALAALTGLIALDSGHTCVGSSDEGVILLPVPAVRAARLIRQSQHAPRRARRCQEPIPARSALLRPASSAGADVGQPLPAGSFPDTMRN